MYWKDSKVKPIRKWTEGSNTEVTWTILATTVSRSADGGVDSAVGSREEGCWIGSPWRLTLCIFRILYTFSVLDLRHPFLTTAQPSADLLQEHSSTELLPTRTQGLLSAHLEEKIFAESLYIELINGPDDDSYLWNFRLGHLAPTWLWTPPSRQLRVGMLRESLEKLQCCLTMCQIKYFFYLELYCFRCNVDEGLICCAYLTLEIEKNA